MDGQTSGNAEQIGMPPTGPPKLELVPPLPAEIGMPPAGEPIPEAALPSQPDMITVPAEIQADIDAKNAAEEKARADALAAIPVLPPMPESIAAPAVEAAPEPEKIGMPPADEAPLAPSTPDAAAAANVIGMPPQEAPSAEPVIAEAAPEVTAEAVSAEEENKGRFGMGVIDTKMPADPSKVPGWNGQVIK